MNARAALTGVWAPACTPLGTDGGPDHRRLIRHVQNLMDGGCHGVVLFGTTGEAVSFSAAERRSALDAVLAAGIERERLIVGTGAAAVSDAAVLTSHATATGCAGVLVLPPFYYKAVSDEGLANFYTSVIEAAATMPRVVLYHFPRLSTVPITHDLVGLLRQRFPGVVVALKDSTGDADSTRSYIEAFPELAVFPGTEAILAEMLAIGAAGCITATANVNAAAIRGLYDALRTSAPDATERQEQVSAVRRCVQTLPAIPALKYLLAVRYGDSQWTSVRPPLTRLTTGQSEALGDALEAAGYAPDSPEVVVRPRGHGPSRGGASRRDVLFVCTHNSARSQMAEGWLRALAGDRFEAHSAGTHPGGVNPLAVRAMAEVNIDLSKHWSKTVDPFIERPPDVVVTVCDSARESCPYVPARERILHHQFEDPSGAEGTDEEKLAVFQRVRDEIKHWIITDLIPGMS